MDYEKRLVRKLLQENEDFEKYLNEQKEYADWIKSMDDWLWFILLQSYGTLGNSKGGSIAHESAMKYNNLASLSKTQRKKIIEKLVKSNGLRYPNKKAQWINDSFELIAGLGGARAATSLAGTLSNKSEKLEFMKQFKGFGDKYARNAWMDLCDSDFANTIAVDSNLNKILDKLGLLVATYLVQEKKLVSIAKSAGITGWELDRLLYKFTNQFLEI